MRVLVATARIMMPTMHIPPITALPLSATNGFAPAGTNEVDCFPTFHWPRIAYRHRTQGKKETSDE